MKKKDFQENCDQPSSYEVVKGKRRSLEHIGQRQNDKFLLLLLFPASILSRSTTGQLAEKSCQLVVKVPLVECSIQKMKHTPRSTTVGCEWANLNKHQLQAMNMLQASQTEPTNQTNQPQANQRSPLCITMLTGGGAYFILFTRLEKKFLSNQCDSLYHFS
ncbi:hypothetical protein T4D_1241 [Trichinella pseudospiralis]|uniref:Uncharacterized protein n=1 Tax=Trichinella pseudospiralis TaxID=6337 RepID=A0A0V1FZN6_TRIPS|nr:hypothetical protein T4D_1241 [Trichinella pseudospiralis]